MSTHRRADAQPGLVLTATALSVDHGPVHAVRDVSVELAGSQLVALTGPSGAGKTSLLWALAGAVGPTSGSVTLDGVAITGREQAARLGIVLVPQGNGLASVLTARENVVVPLLAAGVGRATSQERADEALAAVDLTESGNHLVDELSGGQQQRVAVARALAARGRVILADEPTSDLDGTNRERVIDALRAAAEQGAIVLMATHDPEAAARADAELTLDEGMLDVRRG